MNYVIGLDYGTDSVRAIVAETDTGKIIGQAVEYYPRWAKGMYCDAPQNRFRQHPADHIETMAAAVPKALANCPPGTGDSVIGIAVDTTGSTPVLVDEHCTPLCMLDAYKDDPDGMFILWKDHTSVDEAAEINRAAAAASGKNPVEYVGGIYSSEWFWAKALHTLRKNPALARDTATVIEHCDWIPALLTGVTDIRNLRRSRCAAGHKALWHKDFGGYPARSFFESLHPALGTIRDSLGSETWCSDAKAGTITPEWAEKLGVSPKCAVGVGAFDAHMGAVGAGIGPYQLAKVIGTSTCDILVAPHPDKQGEGGEKVVQGICGQVDGSVIPGMIGYEAGQSAFGDAYAWFKKVLMWPIERAGNEIGGAEFVKAREEIEKNLLDWLQDAAADVDPAESGVLAVDWFNGRRTPDADQNLRGGLAGMNLGTDAPRMFRAIIEATAFGSKAIVERFKREGIPIDSVIALGGVSMKSSLVMQILADVLDVDIAVSGAEQACALGAAMFAAVAGGVYADVGEAQKHMSAGFPTVYSPRPEAAETYRELYRRYTMFGKFEEEFAAARKKGART